MLGGGANPGTGFVPIKPDVTGFGSELEAGLTREGTAATKRASQQMQRAMAGVFAGGAALIGKSVFDFAGFDKQMREVFTLLPGISAPAMDEMSQQVKDFAAEFGVLPTETVPALYQSLSAGVPSDNVFAFIETAQKLAKGGVTDLTTSVDGLTSVVNAYGQEVITAGQASDIMFTTVKLGKTTIGDLSANLFQVTPIAASMGVGFDQVSASMAALTLVTGNTAAASTQLKAMLAELGKDGSTAFDAFKEATGQTFPDFIAAGGTLGEGLVKLDEFAAASGTTLGNMFGSVEAGQGALTLAADNASVFATDLGAMRDSAGATDEAFATMNEGLSATMDRLKARFSIVLLEMGEAMAPTFGAIGEGLAQMLELFSMLPGPMQAVAVLLGTITAGLFAFAKPILAGITLFSKLGGVFSLLAANPWIIVLAGLVTITLLIITHWEEVRAVLDEVWGWMIEAGQGVALFFVDLWNSTTQLVKDAFDSLAQFFVDYWPYVLGIFTGGLGLIVGLVIQNWDQIWGKVQEVTGAIVGAVQTAWSTVLGITTDIGGAVVGFITGIPTTVANAFIGLAEIIAKPFRVAFAGIKAAWNSGPGGFGFSVPSWIPGVGGNSFTIPSMMRGGVAFSPMLAMIGDAGQDNPEIVAPQRMMQDTVAAAISDAGGTGHVFHIHMNVDAGVTDPRFFEDRAVEMVRVAQRELERQRRAEGDSTRGVAA